MSLRRASDVLHRRRNRGTRRPSRRRASQHGLAGRAVARLCRPQPGVRDTSRPAGIVAGAAGGRRRPGFRHRSAGRRVVRELKTEASSPPARGKTRYILTLPRHDISWSLAKGCLPGRTAMTLSRWIVDAPQRLDFDAVEALNVRLIAGTVAVLASDDAPSVVVSELSGRPLQVDLDGGVLTVSYE